MDIRLPTKEFNYYLRRAVFDPEALKIIYEYCTDIIKVHVINRYGVSNYYDNIPHDVTTKIIFESPPDKYFENPVGYLCQAARNHINNIYSLKDNQTLELFDDYPYIPDYEEALLFSDEATEKAWYKLDERARYILYLSEVLKYKLAEIAEMIGKTLDSVKSKKARAKADFKKYVQEFKKDKEVNV